jgi:CheY-like chemotaxis protein
LDIINNILDFSKIEAGKIDLFIEKCAIEELLNQVIDLISYEAKRKNLNLLLLLDPDIPKFLWVDSMRLKQILINLLSNAVKFTTEGNVKLVVSVRETHNDSNTQIRFEVIDSGIGIQKENQSKIFKAFTQEDNSTTRKYGGTGLGLSISNQLLELMNSKLYLDSKINIGSTFYFDINLKSSSTSFMEPFTSEKPVHEINKTMEKKPILISNPIQEPITNSTPDEALFKKEAVSNNFKVLIVEDNKINMLLLKTIIKTIFKEASVFETYNGKEAFEQFEAIQPDIIFMDIQMPIMNGYEATKAIRDTIQGKKIPIIAVTAGTEKEERNNCLAAGMDDYISKPIKKGIIEESINKWLNTFK